MVSKFEGGISGTVYTCGNCKKRTRETGYGESSCQLCKRCYEEAGYENEHSDNGGHDFYIGVCGPGQQEYAEAHCPTCIGHEWWQPVKEGE